MKMAKKIIVIKERTDWVKTKNRDLVMVNLKFNEQRVGLVVDASNSDFSSREIAFRKQNGEIRVVHYLTGDPKIINTKSGYADYTEKDKEFTKYDFILLEVEAK